MKKILFSAWGRNTVLSCLALLSVVNAAWAQNEVLLPFMEQLPQSTYRNPVARPGGRFSIGLPVLSSFGASYRNSAFSLTDIYYNRNDSSIISPNRMIDRMDAKSNVLFMGNTMDLAHVGWRHKNTWWMVNITDKLEVETALPGDLVRLGWQGNQYFINQNRAADFSGTRVKATHWREIGMLMQFSLADEQYLIGVRPKLLFGLSNATLTRSNMSLYTDSANPFTLQARTDFEARISTGNFDTRASITPDFGSVSSYYLNFRNWGLGADIGGRYMPKGSNWNFSAMVTDLGFITWNSNTRTWKGSEQNLNYRGVSYGGLIVDERFVGTNALADSARNALKYSENTDNYVTALTAQGAALAQYKAADWLRLGGGAQFWAFDGIKTALTANALFSYRKWAGLGISYTVQNGRYDNLGLGLYLKPGPIQFYAVTDHALGLAFPTRAYNFNVRTGLNLIIGVDKHDRDKDGVEDKKDACPDVPGTVATQGCPDQDADGVVDNQDECPTVAGLKYLAGCPDADNDSIPDLKDRCPDKAGPARTQGCSDQDGDGIADTEDKCPTVAGLAALQGCPDKDADGITDAEDKCPDVPGLKALQGCPDKDGDGITDAEDQCPDVPGTVAQKGCPEPKELTPVVPEPIAVVVPDLDTDADGVKDKEDDCPKTPGPATNRGCPVLELKQKEIIRRAFANLEFDYNKATIRAVSLPSLKDLASLLKTNQELRLKLAGHTDNMGNAKANLDLSKRRTLAVADFLMKNGAQTGQITSEWYGDTKPVATNKTPAGRKKNRRVEMKVLYQ